MAHRLSFTEVLEAADQLSADEQEQLVSALRCRLAEVARQRLCLEVQEARREFVEGRCYPAAPTEIIREIMK
jgi:hypothetical protein